MARRVPFICKQVSEEFDKAFTQELAARSKEVAENMISSTNIQRFNHGTGWKSHGAYKPDEVNEVKKHTAGTTLSFDDVIAFKVEKIFEQLDQLQSSMAQSFYNMLADVLTEATNETGNIVASKGGMTAEAYRQMIEKIELGVDKDGKVNLPQIIPSSPEALKQLQDDINAQSIEWKKELEELIQAKAKAAIDLEQQRVNKFKKA